MNDDDQHDFLYSRLENSFKTILQAMLTELSELRQICEHIIQHQKQTGQDVLKKPVPTSQYPNQSHLSDLIDAENLIGRDYRMKSDAIAFAIRLEFLYAKTAYGNYNHKLANRAALEFISVHPKPQRDRLIGWCEKHAHQFTGMIQVTPDIFDYLWNLMINSGD